MKFEVIKMFIPSGVFASMSVVNGIDITLRVGTFLLACLSAWLAYKSYKSRKRIEDMQYRQLKEKENENS